MMTKKEDQLSPVNSLGQAREGQNLTHDAVFGEISEDGPNYRNVGWIVTAALMMKTQIGLGVLSIPIAFESLGIVPGVIILVIIAVITTWSDYMIGVFKLNHPEVYGVGDVGKMIFGQPGMWFLEIVFVLYWVFVSGSGMLGVSISLNAISSHATCTAAYVAVSAVIGLILSSIQTLAKIGFMAWGGLFCILTAILIVTIAVGVEDRPASAPQNGSWVPDYKIIASPSFTDAITSVSSIVFAFSGTPSFFSIASEMRDPRMYTRSLMICQSVVTAVYITIGCVVYYFCGSYVASPALSSAGPLVPAKYIFLRVMRGSPHLTSSSIRHWAAWLGCTSGVTIVAYVIASGIPVFDGLVSLIGALLGTLMCFQPMACMWLYDNWSQGKTAKSPRWVAMVIWSGLVLLIGTFLMVAGTYGSAGQHRPKLFEI
ncbi:hypothetical protein N7470_005492 [Penicillium chermesinum]|nr:hypothetical protein N7470_005492 [Penicillium chermesinum]